MILDIGGPILESESVFRRNLYWFNSLVRMDFVMEIGSEENYAVDRVL